MALRLPEPRSAYRVWYPPGFSDHSVWVGVSQAEVQICRADQRLGVWRLHPASNGRGNGERQSCARPGGQSRVERLRVFGAFRETDRSRFDAMFDSGLCRDRTDSCKARMCVELYTDGFWCLAAPGIHFVAIYFDSDFKSDSAFHRTSIKLCNIVLGRFICVSNVVATCGSDEKPGCAIWTRHSRIKRNSGARRKSPCRSSEASPGQST